jgi:thiol:disulfide interchange protein
MRKNLTLLLTLLVTCIATYAADVNWSYDSPSVEITALVPAGHHLYAANTKAGMPLSIIVEGTGVKAVGKPTPNRKPTSQYSDIFMDTEVFFNAGTVKFVQKLKPTAKDYTVKVDVKGQYCNDDNCFQTSSSHTLKGKSPEPKADDKEDAKTEEEEKAENEELAEETAEAVDSLHAEAGPLVPAANDSILASDKNWWNNVEAELKAYSDSPREESRSLLYIFLAGFLGGLIALVTPCVWPMIPMTVSFFLKQNKSRRKSVSQAALYGISIVVIYVALGLIVTAIFGASALNDLATSAVFNIIFFLLLVVFAISFLGGFELTLPSKWTNKMDEKVDSTTGLLSLFFMAFTLVLVSFSCTGPIIGTLLVEAAATSNFVSPAIGMFGFALALALPFTIFAMFPTMLKAMPKSGGWLNTVKVVLGFLELALALKFLSVADLAYGWHILDREVFVSLWIVIFALLGVYLLGKIRFPHDSKVEKTSVPRFMLGVISLAFAVYMLPGLWGAPLKSISAFAPPTHTQDFSLYDGDVKAQTDDFETGMRLARQTGKPVLVDFSGHGCVNCRKMEAAVWTDPGVKNIIDKDFILVTLMVDEKKELPQPIVVTEKDGTSRTLRTVGDKWSYLQRTKFGSNAQPYYVMLDADGKPLGPSYGYKEDVPGYKDFLNAGLKKFAEQQ